MPEQVGINIVISSQVQSAVPGISQVAAALAALQAAARAAAAGAGGSLGTVGGAANGAAAAISKLAPASSAAAAGINNLANAFRNGTITFNNARIAAASAAKGFGVFQTTLKPGTITAMNAAIRANVVTLVQTGNAARAAAQGFGVWTNSVIAGTNAQKILVTQARAGQLSFLQLGQAATTAGRAIARARPATANASSALIDLGRVAQDAPFGFIAIQNNIPVLIDSFTRLSATAGGTSAAFRALGGAILGPAGIGLAVSALVSLTTVAIQRYGSLSVAIDAIVGLQTKAEATAFAYNKAIAEGIGQVGGEIAKINGLLSVARDETISRDQRLRAIQLLQKEYPDYLKNLNLENVNSVATAQSIDKISEALIRQARVRGAQELISKESQKIFEAQVADISSQAGILTKTLAAGIGGINPAAAKALTITSGIKNIAEVSKEGAERIQRLQDIINDLLKTDAKAGTLGFGEKLEKTGTAARTAADVLKELSTELGIIDTQAATFGASVDDISDAKIGALQSAFRGLLEVGLKPTSPELQKILAQIQLLSVTNVGSIPVLTKQLQNLGQAAQEVRVPNLSVQQLRDLLGLVDQTSQLQLSDVPVVKLPQIEVPSLENVDKFQADMNKKFEATRAALKKQGESLTQVAVDIKPLISNAFSGIGEAIGSALGGGGLQALFGGILKVITGFIKSLGESLVAAGTAMLALKALKLNPVTSIIAGVAAIAISTALEAKINASVPRFAKGGIAVGPQLAIVGDNPGGREMIIPSEDFGKLGGTQVMIPEFRISGADLVVLFNRATSQNRSIN